VDVRDNSLLWSEHYQRKIVELQDTHAQIAKEVCAKLGVQLSEREQMRLSKKYTENTDAYLLYLEGVHWLRKWTSDGVKRSIECFENALSLDPKNALAHSARAEAYLGASYLYLPPKEGLLTARIAAEKALQLDDELAEAHTALGIVKYHYDWDRSGAEREFRRAIQLNPRYAMAHDWYAWCLVGIGRFDEAIEQILQAQQLEPRSATISADVAYMLYLARQYDDAIEQANRALELDPRNVVALEVLSHASREKGDFVAALAAAERIKPWEEPVAMVLTAVVLARSGKRAEALQALDALEQLSKERHNNAAWRASVYAVMGETDQALYWLEIAADERTPVLTLLKVVPEADSLQSDPRFVRLLRKMNLPP
jgi:Tfp pilus assembly protein PilF